MQTSDLETSNKIENQPAPKSYKMFILILAAAVIIALILVATTHPDYLR